MADENPIIIYNTSDGQSRIVLMSRDGTVWLNQNQMAELFDTSKQLVGHHIRNILLEKELDENSVIKQYFTTAKDGKNYNVTYYALPMILAVGFRVRGVRGVQFRQWANSALRETCFRVNYFSSVWHTDFMDKTRIFKKTQRSQRTQRENLKPFFVCL